MSDEKDTTEDTTEKQDQDTTPAKPKLQLLGAEEHLYNAPEIIDFIGSVFTGVDATASRLFYSERSNVPRMPVKFDRIKNVVERSTHAKALYMNTATCRPDDSGTLRHKKELFSALHVVVLDDIGTKIDASKIPADMAPSYIIETSKDNFQYGYVLSEPLTDYDQAASLIQTMALAGLTDKGGAMPCKIVRLPAGVNGKNDPDKRLFKVKLIDNSGSSYTPEQLLDRVNHEIDGHKVTWAGIQAGDSPLGRTYRTKHMRLQPQALSTDGVVDEVLEWLIENDQVIQDSGEWVSIVCPWCHGHTSGSDEAGYSPLGRGDNPFLRGFNCFHDHCSDRNTLDFIQYVMGNSDLNSIPIYNPSQLRAGDFAYDMTADRVWAIGQGDLMYTTPGFKTGFNDVIFTYDKGQKKPRRTTAANMWLNSPYRITVHGAISDPRDGDIVERNGKKFVNTFKQPPWGSGKYDQAHVDRFESFVNYLLPDPVEQVYFFDWLAAKAQDPTFRGTGVVMLAENQGVGRSTLANMFYDLFGAQNCADVSFDALVNPQSFNYWEDKLIVTVAETVDTGQFKTVGAIKAYETLKQRVDTSNNWVTLNLKGRPQRPVRACSSFLILTNHLNALGLAINDRRLTVLTNTLVPETPQFFTDLHVWLQTDWAKHVYRWLLTRQITSTLILPLDTAAKVDMTTGTQSTIVRICTMLNDNLMAQGIYAITTPHMKEIVNKVLLGIHDDTDYKPRHLTHSFNDISMSFKHFRVFVDGKTAKVRVLKAAASLIPNYTVMDKHAVAADIDRETKNAIAVSVDKVDVAALVTELVDDLDS